MALSFSRKDDIETLYYSLLLARKAIHKKEFLTHLKNAPDLIKKQHEDLLKGINRVIPRLEDKMKSLETSKR